MFLNLSYGQDVSFLSFVTLVSRLRLWGGPDRLRGKFQFTKPPGLLPRKLCVCVGDPGPVPVLDPDSRLLFERGGSVALPV